MQDREFIGVGRRLNRPEIALVADSESDLEAAKLLIGTLGVFQVEALQQREKVAQSVHTVIYLTPHAKHVPPRGPATLYLDDRADFASNVDTPASSKRITTYVPSSREERLSKAEDGFLQAAFWMDQRLFKASGPLAAGDLKLWILVCEIGLGVGAHSINLWQSICSRVASLNPQLTNNSIKARSPSAAAAEIFLRELPEKYRHRMNEAITAHRINRQSLGEIYASLQDSISIMAFAIYQWLHGEEAPLEQSIQALRGPEWTHPATSFPRMTRDASSFAYSPLALLWLYLTFIRGNPEKSPNETPIYLEKISSEGSLSPPPNFYAGSSQGISHSAWKLWRSLHQMPSIQGRQILLTSESYSALLHDLQDYWLDVFRSIQHQKERVFCFAAPWPNKKKSALSLRFDVDRYLTEEHVRNVISVQRRRLPATSGSWYFSPNDPSTEKWKVVLEYYGQEVGIHALKAKDAQTGIGITHHSAPSSEYWQGDVTMQSLNQNGALYGEFLGNLVPIPRPMLIEAETGERVRSQTFFTGPGFPLEGSTADTNLDYFDRLIHRFHEQLGRGGHAVIITHPDLNMNLLDDLLQREHLENVWISSTKEIVSRVGEIMNYGVLLSATRAGGVDIWSESQLKEVHFSLDHPKKTFPASRIANISPKECLLSLGSTTSDSRSSRNAALFDDV